MFCHWGSTERKYEIQGLYSFYFVYCFQFVILNTFNWKWYQENSFIHSLQLRDSHKAESSSKFENDWQITALSERCTWTKIIQIIFFCLCETVWSYSTSCPGTHYEDQASLCLSSAGIKGMVHNTEPQGLGGIKR